MSPDEYDAFICYKLQDDKNALALKGILGEKGYRVWLYALLPEKDKKTKFWAYEVAPVLRRSRTLLVLVGPDGIGEGASQELEAFLDRDPTSPIIPVLLPDGSWRHERVPGVLLERQEVRFKRSVREKEPLAQLFELIAEGVRSARSPFVTPANEGRSAGSGRAEMPMPDARCPACHLKGRVSYIEKQVGMGECVGMIYSCSACGRTWETPRGSSFGAQRCPKFWHHQLVEVESSAGRNLICFSCGYETSRKELAELEDTFGRRVEEKERIYNKVSVPKLLLAIVVLASIAYGLILGIQLLFH